MNTHDEQSEERRKEYQRRHAQALQDGGRMPDDAEWSELLGQARAVIEADTRRRAAAVRGALMPQDLMPQGKEPRRFLPPGHVAIHAKAVLGLEAELNDVRASREAVEQQRMQLLGLISRAKTALGPSEPDLFALEIALATGEGLPRNAEAQLLEVVREVIRWRGAVGKADPGAAIAVRPPP